MSHQCAGWRRGGVRCRRFIADDRLTCQSHQYQAAVIMSLSDYSAGWRIAAVIEKVNRG
jgi:hypothetical protein